MKFIKNSSSNRVFCDAMIKLIAVEILLSGKLDENVTISSYKRINPEFKTGKHGGFSFIPISEKINEKEIIKLKEIVSEGFQKGLKNIAELRTFLADKLEVSDDYLHCLNDGNNLQYTFQIAENKRKILI